MPYTAKKIKETKMEQVKRDIYVNKLMSRKDNARNKIIE